MSTAASNDFDGNDDQFNPEDNNYGVDEDIKVLHENDMNEEDIDEFELETEQKDVHLRNFLCTKLLSVNQESSYGQNGTPLKQEVSNRAKHASLNRSVASSNMVSVGSHHSHVPKMHAVIPEEIVVMAPIGRLNDLGRARLAAVTNIGRVIPQKKNNKLDMRLALGPDTESRLELFQDCCDLMKTLQEKLNNEASTKFLPNVLDNMFGEETKDTMIKNRIFAPIPNKSTVLEYEVVLSKLLHVFSKVGGNNLRSIAANPIAARICAMVSNAAVELQAILMVTKHSKSGIRNRPTNKNKKQRLKPGAGKIGKWFNQVLNPNFSVGMEFQSEAEDINELERLFTMVGYVPLYETSFTNFLEMRQVDLLEEAFSRLAELAAKAANEIYEPMGLFIIDPEAQFQMFHDAKSKVLLTKLVAYLSTSCERISKGFIVFKEFQTQEKRDEITVMIHYLKNLDDQSLSLLDSPCLDGMSAISVDSNGNLGQRCVELLSLSDLDTSDGLGLLSRLELGLLVERTEE